jgi:RimJ/RimL family protein N-acetyltransferase
MVWLNVIAIAIQSTTVGGASATMQDGPMSDVEVMNGPRVTLRAPTVDDADLIFERMASDPEVSRYMSWRPHRDVGETRRVITEIFNVGGETTWLILRSGDGPIGLCGWRRPQPHIIDFGYYLGRRWWRQGIMSEAVQLLLDKAQRDPTVYRVTAHCHVDNIASARLLERSGLTLEGRLARYAVLPNISLEPQDCLLFGKALR